MKRIAMWSGPRNISTAMMRAFEHRADTVVMDEPFYAYYLATTGKTHPGRDAVLAAQPNDWRDVARALHAGPDDARIEVIYQKHMAHHICGDMTLEWIDGLAHAFLLREPAAMLCSLARVLGEVTLADTGLPQQVNLYRLLRERGIAPPVIDSKTVLTAPRAALEALCAALDVPFDPAMLSWPAGPRPSDGVWAPHWYASVEASTGFGPYVPFDGQVPDAIAPLVAPCRAIYDELAENKIEV